VTTRSIPAWCQAASIACDLLASLRLLALDGDLAKAERKTLRYKVLHTAGQIVKGQRRRYLKIAPAWLWAQDIADTFTRILALPPP
jgi:DDE family transposase